MTWDETRRLLKDLDSILKSLSLPVPSDSHVSHQLAIVKKFLVDNEVLTEVDLLKKWQEQDFKTFCDAAVVVQRLARAVVALQNQPRKVLKGILKIVLNGSITQDLDPNQSKDFFYELEVAYRLQKAGFNVELREPDVVVSGSGLSRKIGIACKYPSSEKQIHNHISKGYRQITSQKLDGVVAFGMDLIVFGKSFDSPPRFLDFRQNSKPPMHIVQGTLDNEIAALIADRPSKYPSETPLDGAMLSLDMWGFHGKPASLTEVTAWTLQCDIENPLAPDLLTIMQHLYRCFPNPYQGGGVVPDRPSP